MPLTIWPPSHDTVAQALQPFEQVVRDVLGDAEEPLDVRFGVCAGDDGRASYVCKVEGPPAAAFNMEEQWRWWSPIVSEPDQLRASLREAVARRRRRTVASTGLSAGAREDSVRSTAG